jgi:hypothetical protein
MTPARWLIAMLCLASCGGEPLTTTDEPCGHGERSLELPIAFSQQLDALIVVDPALGDRIQPRLASLLEALATSNVDDHPDRDLFRIHELRVAIITAEQATHFYRAPERPPAFARYRYAPHGYGDDVASFVRRALCMQTSDAAACASAPIDGELPFANRYAAVYVISDRDACTAQELAGPSERGCDARLNELLATVRDEPTLDPYWELSLVAGVPLALGSLAGTQEILDEHESPAHMLEDPSLRDADANSDICAGDADISARPTPELLRLADTGRVLSVCAASYREVTAMFDCFGCYATIPGHFIDAALRADGTYACELRETLPSFGLITRCEQLAAFGREATPIAIDEGREVCVVQQFTEAEAAAGSVFGWYMPTHDDPRYVWRGNPDAKPWCLDSFSRGTTAFDPALTLSTETIAGSQLHIRCSLAHGGALQSCE